MTSQFLAVPGSMKFDDNCIGFVIVTSLSSFFGSEFRKKSVIQNAIKKEKNRKIHRDDYEVLRWFIPPSLQR